MNPNPEQQAVIDTHNGEIALISGPGSGKTATLTARRESLIAAGVHPSEILCVTFSKEAALEMAKRSGKGEFRTFHSYGLSILTAELGKAPIEPELRHRLLYGLCKRYKTDYKELAKAISNIRHGGAGHTVPYNYLRAYEAYEDERRTAGWIDFDSMICDSVNLLEKPEVRARHQWKYIMADECQDTDDLQFRMLQLISEKYHNVMCVGDPGQSIYMFRGAKPENLTDFTRWFPNGKMMYLGRNYRSTQTLVTFIRENYPIKGPLVARLLPHRTEIGVPIEYKIFQNSFDEAESAVVRANEAPMESAILARTNRALGPIENFCCENDIPYHLLGKTGFWKQHEIVRTVEKLKPYANLTLTAAFGLVMPAIETHYRAEDATPEDNYALENIRSLRDIGKRFTSCRDFVVFANKCQHAKKTKKGITIGTIHAAKGTEHKNVYLIDFRADMVPHIKGDPEEEARLFLVAISRPKDKLNISWVGTPSPYLRRYLPEDVLVELINNSTKVEKLKKQFSLL